jgi:hypothetical protein
LKHELNSMIHKCVSNAEKDSKDKKRVEEKLKKEAEALEAAKKSPPKKERSERRMS